MVPKVVFVLGGPGAGKGTQCENIVQVTPGKSGPNFGDSSLLSRRTDSSTSRPGISCGRSEPGPARSTAS